MLHSKLNLKIFTNPIERRNESTKVLDINADVCKFYTKNNGANPFTTFLLALVHKHGKIAHCPMKMVRFVPVIHYKIKVKILRDTTTSII